MKPNKLTVWFPRGHLGELEIPRFRETIKFRLKFCL
jgi:hypothetical protein